MALLTEMFSYIVKTRRSTSREGRSNNDSPIFIGRTRQGKP